MQGCQAKALRGTVHRKKHCHTTDHSLAANPHSIAAAPVKTHKPEDSAHHTLYTSGHHRHQISSLNHIHPS